LFLIPLEFLFELLLQAVKSKKPLIEILDEMEIPELEEDSKREEKSNSGVRVEERQNTLPSPALPIESVTQEFQHVQFIDVRHNVAEIMKLEDADTTAEETAVQSKKESKVNDLETLD
jgi:hypothetical protein